MYYRYLPFVCGVDNDKFALKKADRSRYCVIRTHCLGRSTFCVTIQGLAFGSNARKSGQSHAGLRLEKLGKIV